MKKNTLEKICMDYCNIDYNSENYAIGGGLDANKFASNRHEDAKNDFGKNTLGEAAQMFRAATGCTLDEVKDIINYAIPNMEWHHAGKLPKSYGGGMKKTYFLNAEEICDLAKNWTDYSQKLAISKAAKNNAADEKRALESRKQDFLKQNAKRFERKEHTPPLSFITSQEMQGKFGWFDSRYKSYKLPEFFSGWEFETIEQKNEYFNIK